MTDPAIKRVPARLQHTVAARAQGKPTFSVTLTSYDQPRHAEVVAAIRAAHSSRSSHEAQEMAGSLPCLVASGLPDGVKARLIAAALTVAGGTADIAQEDPKSEPAGPGW